MGAGTLKFGNKKDAAIGKVVLLAVAKVLKKAAKAAEKSGSLEITLIGGRQKKGDAAKAAKGKKATKAKQKQTRAGRKAAAKPKPKAKPPVPPASA